MLNSPFARCVLRQAPAALLLAAVLSTSSPLSGQGTKGGGKGKQPDFIPAGYDDYQNMLDQLGIKKMRKGRDGRRDTSKETTANRDKDTLPALMVFKDGTKVKTADQWLKRRTEIVEDFEREVYGRVPRNVPKVKWEVTSTVEGESGGIAIITKTLVGHVDNRAFPKLEIRIQASFTVPKYAAGRVPLLMQFGFAGKAGGKGGRELVDATGAQQRLGLRHDQPGQHSGGRQQVARRHYRPDQQGPAAPSGRLGSAARLGLGP